MLVIMAGLSDYYCLLMADDDGEWGNNDSTNDDYLFFNVNGNGRNIFALLSLYTVLVLLMMAVMMGWLKLKLRLVCACAAVVVHFRCACNENAGKRPTQPTHTLHYVKKMKKEKAFIQPLPS